MAGANIPTSSSPPQCGGSLRCDATSRWTHVLVWVARAVGEIGQRGADSVCGTRRLREPGRTEGPVPSFVCGECPSVILARW